MEIQRGKVFPNEGLSNINKKKTDTTAYKKEQHGKVVSYLYINEMPCYQY